MRAYPGQLRHPVRHVAGVIEKRLDDPRIKPAEVFGKAGTQKNHRHKKAEREPERHERGSENFFTLQPVLEPRIGRPRGKGKNNGQQKRRNKGAEHNKAAPQNKGNRNNDDQRPVNGIFVDIV